MAYAGITFGPHSVTHPSLATADPASMEWEITESYGRLAEEIDAPLPVFCYPYGMAQDVSEEVARAARRSGLAAAVSAMGGYVSPPADQRELRRFLLPRFAFVDRLTDLRQIVHGFERFKTLTRRAVGG